MTTVTYPGVYIQEIPSGVRTITGVATSVTAFIGRAVRGEVNEPRIINSFADFERMFGGLHKDYPMSYAIRDFYNNGGAQAIIVRLYRTPTDDADTPLNTTARISLGTDRPTLVAASPGSWGNQLSVEVDYDTKENDEGDPDENLYNLTITDGSTGATEKIMNVSVHPDYVRQIDKVLEKESSLVRIEEGSDLGTGRPAEDTFTVEDADEGHDSASLENGDYAGSVTNKTGLYALEKSDIFNLLCIPPDTRNGDTDVGVYDEALGYCVKRRAMLIVDSPASWSTNKDTAAQTAKDEFKDYDLKGVATRNAALFFPRVRQADLMRDRQIASFVPCGIVAGVFSRTDSSRGVWKAPAGLDASMNGIVGLEVNLTDDENGMLNPLGINCLRSFPVTGRVIWGSRTLRGADQLADEYKYIPVRRLALFIEESLYRGTQWVVFEPNDEPLWAQIRLNIGAFMHDLFRKGAFAGQSPRDAYFVKCDKETTTQNDINKGIVNIIVGFAPLKPAEFVIIKIQQIAGDIES